MSLLVDEGAWPVLILAIDGQGAGEDVDAYLAAMERALARDEPFAMVLVDARREDEQPPDPRAVHRQMTWLKANRPRIAAQCRGIVYHFAVAERAARSAAIVRQGTQIWGCPVDLAATVVEARQWAGRQVSAEPVIERPVGTEGPSASPVTRRR